MDMSWQLDALGLIGLAALLGGIVGLERELASRSAGLRTHLLVTAAAAAVILLGGSLNRLYDASSLGDAASPDPMRLFEAVMVGVAFIGGGAILKDQQQNTVRNLTTATSLFFTATIGIAVAQRLFLLAAGMTGLVLIVNTVVRFLEHRYVRDIT